MEGGSIFQIAEADGRNDCIVVVREKGLRCLIDGSGKSCSVKCWIHLRDLELQEEE